MWRRFPSWSWKEGKSADIYCAWGVSLASFHHFLPLISVTSCLAKKVGESEQGKERDREGRVTEEQRKMRGTGENENLGESRKREKSGGGGFIERWRRGERRSEKIREREVELWRGSKELSHGGERETDETAGSVMEGGGEKTVTKFHGTNYR